MSSIPDNKSGLLAKATKVVPQRLTSFDGKNTEQVIIELQKAVQQMVFVLQELQQKQFASRFVDVSGFPLDKSRCEVLDGQWLHLKQTAAAGQVITIFHGLGRKPQGILFVIGSSQVPQILLTGTTSVEPANEKKVSFRLNGSSGDLNVVVLF